MSYNQPMLYVFHGSEIKESGEKARTLVNSLRTKRPDAAYEKVDADSWNPALIEGHLGGQGLFSSKYIIFVDRVTENAEAKEQFPAFIPAMQESDNIFIVLEGKLNAELKKAVAGSAEKAVESEPKTKKNFFADSGPNVFALADALGARDAFKAWSVYRQVIDGGTEPENILGTLFWQAKSMVLAAGTGSAGESGLSPFVYTKAKRGSANYSRDELDRLTSDLVVLYHDGHRGKRNLELATERLLLNCGKPQM